MNKKKKILTFAITGVIVLILPVIVFAAKEKADDNIYVAEDEVIMGNYINAGNIVDLNANVDGDVILAGSAINIRGDVTGNVFAFGQTVTISGNIDGSLFTAASEIDITGAIGGSIYGAGNNVKFNSHVAKNIYAAGSTLTMEDGSSVGRHAHLGGAIVSVNGPIETGLRAGGAEVSLNSTINGGVNADIEDGNLTIGQNAVINGDLVYTSTKEATIREGAVINGETVHNTPEAKAATTVFKPFTGIGFGLAFGLVSALAIGLIVAGIFRKFTLRVAKNLTKRVGPSFGWGAIFLFASPVAAIICMITVIGIPLGLVIMGMYIIGIYLSFIFAGFTLGYVIFKGHKGETKIEKGKFVGVTLLGILIYYLVTQIPIIGWLVGFAGTLWALGGITMTLFNKKVEVVNKS